MATKRHKPDYGGFAASSALLPQLSRPRVLLWEEIACQPARFRRYSNHPEYYLANAW